MLGSRLAPQTPWLGEPSADQARGYPTALATAGDSQVSSVRWLGLAREWSDVPLRNRYSLFCCSCLPLAHLKDHPIIMLATPIAATWVPGVFLRPMVHDRRDLSPTFAHPSSPLVTLSPSFPPPSPSFTRRKRGLPASQFQINLCQKTFVFLRGLRGRKVRHFRASLFCEIPKI